MAFRPLRSLAPLLWLALAAVPARAEEDPAASLNFQKGPGTFPIAGELAEIDLPDEFVFLDADGSKRFMEMQQNPVGGDEVATMLPLDEKAGWFVILEWDEMGHVDDKQSDLDNDAILASMREGTEAANAERAKRGWPAFHIVGWHEPPHYDAVTHNLTWAIAGQADGASGQTINRLIKLLGRRGVMTATLVASPGELAAASASTDALLASYRFKPGHTYAEFLPGKDRLADAGLAALIVGGTGAALLKSGLLAKLWKLLVGGAVLAGGAVRRFFRGRRAEDEPITRA